jgi:hypothetical protein
MSWLAERESRPIAHRIHICDQCLQPIATGEKYYRCAGLFDSKPLIYKAHLDCADCADEIHQIYGGDAEEGISLIDDVRIEPDWQPFVAEKYPAVATRIWPSGAP